MRYKQIVRIDDLVEDEVNVKRIGLIMLGIGGLLAVIFGGKKLKEVIDMQKRNRVLAVINRWKHLIIKYADKWGVQRSLVASIITQESNGKPTAPHAIIPRLHITVLGWTQGEKWKQHPNYNKPEIFNRAYGLMGILYPNFLALLYGIPKCFTMTPPISVLTDPNTNIDMGTKVFKTEKLVVCRGDIKCALAKYGEGIIYANEVLALTDTLRPGDFAV